MFQMSIITMTKSYQITISSAKDREFLDRTVQSIMGILSSELFLNHKNTSWVAEIDI